MLLLHDRATMARALTLNLDPRLHALLKERIEGLSSGEYDLTDDTEILVVGPGDSERDIIREVGFSPLVEPIDGARFGEPGFASYWDSLTDRDGWFEMVVTFGSTFGLTLLVADADGVLSDLLTLCRAYAA
jgi:hypothetical protein